MGSFSKVRVPDLDAGMDQGRVLLSSTYFEGTRAGNDLELVFRSRIGNRRAHKLALPLSSFGRFSMDA
jgi:hypothetical protein